MPDLQAYQPSQDFFSAATQGCAVPDLVWDFSQDNYSEALIYDPTDLETVMTEPICGPIGYPFDLSV